MIEGNPNTGPKNPDKPVLRSADVHNQMLSQGYVNVPAGTEITYSFWTKHADGEVKEMRVTGATHDPLEAKIDDTDQPQVSADGKIIEVFHPDSAERRALFLTRKEYEDEIDTNRRFTETLGSELGEDARKFLDESRGRLYAAHRDLGFSIGDLDHKLGNDVIAPVREEILSQGAEAHKVIGLTMHIPLKDDVDGEPKD